MVFLQILYKRCLGGLLGARAMNILLVKTSALGDILQCFSVIGYLKKVFPNASIDWVVEQEYSALLQAHPGVRRVIPIQTKVWRRQLFSRKMRKSMQRAVMDIRQSKYDCLFDLQGNLKSGVITALAKSREKVGFSFQSAPEWPAALPLSHRETVNKQEKRAEQYLGMVVRHLGQADHPPLRELTQVALNINRKEARLLASLDLQGPSKRPRLMVCLGSRWKNKQLSLELWGEFLSAIAKRLQPEIFFPYKTEEEKRAIAALKCALPVKTTALGSLSVSLWQRVMDAMDGVLSVDSAALHLAATTSTPVFGIFGPSSAHAYHPSGAGFFQGECPYGEVFLQRCPTLRSCPTGACSKKIQKARLIEAFFAWWEQ